MTPAASDRHVTMRNGSSNGNSRSIAVITWERFQHYKDRNPPWIKLYGDMLTSEPWVLGTDTSRLVQVAITLLAARYQNATPYNFELIKKVTHFDFDEQQFDTAVEYLVSAKFIQIHGVAESASGALAKRKQRAIPEKRRGEKTKNREEKIHIGANRFDEIRAVYPTGTGHQDWAIAQHHYHLRIERGVTHEHLLERTQCYRRYCDNGGVSGPKYVTGPQKFFADIDGPWTKEYTLPATKAESRLKSNLTAGEEFMRRTEQPH
jgi:hypothetical protein